MISTDASKGIRYGTAVVIMLLAIAAVSAFTVSDLRSDDAVIGANGSVAIDVSENTSVIQTNVQNAINASSTSGGGRVTVTGSKPDASSTITLTIPAGVSVIWDAEFRSSMGLMLRGLGSFEASGEKVSFGSVTVMDGCGLKINGDLVFGITTPGSSSMQASGGSTINITGNLRFNQLGYITAGDTSSRGTVNIGGNLTFTGANSYIRVSGPNSGAEAVKIGGNLRYEATGFIQAIASGTAEIKGSVTFAAGGYIDSSGTSVVRISGGAVFATGSVGRIDIRDTAKVEINGNATFNYVSSNIQVGTGAELKIKGTASFTRDSCYITVSGTAGIGAVKIDGSGSRINVTGGNFNTDGNVSLSNGDITLNVGRIEIKGDVALGSGMITIEKGRTYINGTITAGAEKYIRLQNPEGGYLQKGTDEYSEKDNGYYLYRNGADAFLYVKAPEEDNTALIIIIAAAAAAAVAVIYFVFVRRTGSGTGQSIPDKNGPKGRTKEGPRQQGRPRSESKHEALRKK